MRFQSHTRRRLSSARRICIGVAALALPAAVLAASPAQAAGGATIFVAPSPPGIGAGSGSCLTPNYNTIGAAVAAASNGDTIDVCAGTYAENVAINKSLTVDGAQAGIDARTRSGSESIINGGSGANLTITADNVTVDGFTLNGPSSSAAIVMENGNVGETIQNNIINNPGAAAYSNTSDTVIRKNVVNNVFASATDGFQFNTSPIHDVSISDNKFGGANENNYNADVTIIGPFGGAVNSNITVSGNAANGDGTLVALFTVNGAHVTGNTVTGGVHSSQIYVGGGNSNVTISGNTVSSGGSAVNVANAFGDGPNSSVTITGNNFRNNGTGVKVGSGAIASGGSVVANRNRLAGNSAFGINNLSSFTVDGTCNWWGTGRGPGAVGPGSGDKVSTDVTYAPWLDSSSLSGACAHRTGFHVYASPPVVEVGSPVTVWASGASSNSSITLAVVGHGTKNVTTDSNGFGFATFTINNPGALKIRATDGSAVTSGPLYVAKVSIPDSVKHNHQINVSVQSAIPGSTLNVTTNRGGNYSVPVPATGHVVVHVPGTTTGTLRITVTDNNDPLVVRNVSIT